jgi:hypothetical protein
VVDIVGLYTNPPERAAVFWFAWLKEIADRRFDEAPFTSKRDLTDANQVERALERRPRAIRLAQDGREVIYSGV